MKSWFRFENAAADPTVAEIHIIDFIGSWGQDLMNRYYGEQIGVTARAFVEQLAALPEAVKTIKVHINSPGGDVQAGVNIANALREQQSKGRSVETFIDGIAASIASVIAMAGSKVHIADNALVMIHNPYTVGIGNAAEMRKTADVLDAIRGQIIATYKWHSSLDDAAIAALMDAETWMDATEAIDRGFATDKVEGLQAAASIDPRAVGALKVPEKFKARVDALLAKPEPRQDPVAAGTDDVLRLCADAGLDLAFARTLIDSKATLADVTAKVAGEKGRRAAAATRATEIRAACALANLPELAEGYIGGAMTLDAVKAHLAALRPKLDKAEIDGGLDPSQGGRPKARIDVAAVYAARNRLTTAKE